MKHDKFQIGDIVFHSYDGLSSNGQGLCIILKPWHGNKNEYINNTAMGYYVWSFDRSKDGFIWDDYDRIKLISR